MFFYIEKFIDEQKKNKFFQNFSFTIFFNCKYNIKKSPNSFHKNGSIRDDSIHVVIKFILQTKLLVNLW